MFKGVKALLEGELEERAMHVFHEVELVGFHTDSLNNDGGLSLALSFRTRQAESNGLTNRNTRNNGSSRNGSSRNNGSSRYNGQREANGDHSGCNISNGRDDDEREILEYGNLVCLVPGGEFEQVFIFFFLNLNFVAQTVGIHGYHTSA